MPPRTAAEVVEAFPFHRQSLLADADNCMLSTKFRLEAFEAFPHLRASPASSPWNSAEQARGIVFHRYAAEVLRTLWETGNVTMSVAEALEILYEVSAQREVDPADVVYLPSRERRLLRICAILLVWEPSTRLSRTWSMERLMSIEERLWAKVSYVAQDGATVERHVTGQPDAVVGDPPDGVVVLDWKTTPKAPAKPPESKRDDRGDFPADDVADNVSYLGYFQQRVYALLLFADLPAVDRVTMREWYPLETPGNRVRSATVFRRDIERIARDLSIGVELLDRALEGGSRSEIWKPTPGRHCGYCPRPGSCPIPEEERRDGITSAREASEWGADFVVADEIRTRRRSALKAWHEETGRPIPVKAAKGRYELRWGTSESGARSFGLHVPERSDRGPQDPNLEHAFREAAERRKEAAA